MRKRLALSVVTLLFAGCAIRAQPSRVQIIVNATAAGATPPISTLGAISHQVVLIASNAPAHTCTTPVIAGSLQFSFDNANWFPFGGQQGNSGLLATYLGASSFDYVRFNLAGFDTTNCLLNGWYLGSATPLLSSVMGNTQAGFGLKTSSGWGENPLFMGGLGDLGLKQPILVCDGNATVTVTAPNTVVVTSVTSASLRFRVCSVTLTSTAAGSAQFAQADASTACVTNLISTGIVYSLTASVLTVFMGSNLGQLFNLGLGKDLCLTGVSGTTTALVSYARTPY